MCNRTRLGNIHFIIHVLDCRRYKGPHINIGTIFIETKSEGSDFIILTNNSLKILTLKYIVFVTITLTQPIPSYIVTVQT